MTHTVTVKLPSLIRVGQVLLIIFVAILVMGAGLFVGTRITATSEVQKFSKPGQLQELRLASGGLVVGRIGSDSGGYTHVANAADVSAGSGDQTGATIVTMITAEPIDADGEMIVSDEQIVLVMNVTPGSGLETAYRQAIGELPKPTPAPTATPAPSAQP